ncbi:MAG: ABC transporter permease [Lewinellaceae bacterium]|nr:ABC transporter permease [Lewinellaceae bacterium]
MFQNNLKIAWRNLQKNKVTGFINIAGLTIGMAVAMMIGLWMNDELTFDQYHKNYDRLGQLYVHQVFNGHKGTGQAMSSPIGPGLRSDFGSDFEHIAMSSWNFEHLLTVGEKKLVREGLFAEPDLPKMLSLHLLSGNMETVLAEPKSILLSRSVAEALFGSADVLGKMVKLDNEHDMAVSGVFEDLPYNCRFAETTYFIPWSHYLATNEWVRKSADQWDNHSFQCFVQLAEQTDFETVNAKIKDMELRHNENGEPALFVFPMAKWHLYSQFEEGENVGGRIQYVRLFGIIGVFVLLLACINFMNLSTARSEKRAKEVGIRKTIGSQRGQLIGQFLSESLLVSFLSLFIAVALVQVSLAGFNNLADKKVALPWDSPVFWLMSIGFAAFTGLLAGSYPAFYLSSFKPLQVLKGVFKTGRMASLPRQVLVTLQFTVSVVLIIGTIVVFQQIEHAKNRPVGYNKEALVQFSVSPELNGKTELFRTEMLATGAAEEVSYSNAPVTNIYSNQIGFDWEGRDPQAQPLFTITYCSFTYGKTIGWEIVEGRDFDPKISGDSSALILNEAAVKFMGLENPVGMTIRQGDTRTGEYDPADTRTVVGVVKDMVMESPWEPTRPAMFKLEMNWSNTMLVRLKAGMPIKDALAEMEKVYAKLSPSSPFEYNFVDDDFDQKFRSEERVGKLARIFAILAIFISCLGLFGLSAFVAEQKTKEIGIRKVLGATVANLWAMQSKGFVGLVILSCLIAVPIAWYYLDGWLADYEYRINLGWGVFAAAAILALVVTLFTVSFQSIRAALANPVKSLRSE